MWQMRYLYDNDMTYNWHVNYANGICMNLSKCLGCFIRQKFFSSWKCFKPRVEWTICPMGIFLLNLLSCCKFSIELFCYWFIKDLDRSKVSWWSHYLKISHLKPKTTPKLIARLRRLWQHFPNKIYQKPKHHEKKGKKKQFLHPVKGWKFL